MQEAKRVSRTTGQPTGRPPVDTEAVTFRAHRRVLVRLDDWRRAQPDLPTRTEAVRRLLEKALGK
jgi:hypothetical protein